MHMEAHRSACPLISAIWKVIMMISWRSSQWEGLTLTRKGRYHGHLATADPPHPPHTPAPA